MRKYGYIVVEGPHDVEFVYRLLSPFGVGRVRLEADLERFFQRLIPRDYPPGGDLQKRMATPLFLQSDTHAVAVHGAVGDTRLVETVEENATRIDMTQVTGIGIILDSDKQVVADARYTAIKAGMQTKGYELPANAGEVSPGTPRLGAFVLPDNANMGTLENLLIECAQQVYPNLCPGFVARPPVAADLAGAMRHLLSQALEHEFPAAPFFEAEAKPGTLKKVYELVLPAAEAPDGRLAIDKTLRPLVRQIANPLMVGEMGTDATHFVLGQHWKTHFARKAADTGSAMVVGKLRDWINDPKPMGMPKEAENLVILLFATQTNRTFYRHGGPYEPTLLTIPDDCELRSVALPAAGVWEPAVQRAGSIFGVAGSRLVTATNVGTLSAEVKKRAGEARPACVAYCQRLKHRMTGIGIAPEKTARMKTAVATRALVDSLDAAEASSVVGILAAAEIATSEAAMGECRTRAAELDGNLETAGWDIFEAIGKLTDDRQQAAQEILAELREALSSDEHVVGLAPALTSAQARAVRLLTKVVPPPPPPPPPLPPTPGWRVVDEGEAEGLDLSKAKDKLAALERKLRGERRIQVQISWRIEEKK